MISVDTLYSNLNDSLKKNQGGYVSNDEYNRMLINLQVDLMDYHETQGTTRKQSVTQPFVKEMSGVGTVALPADFRYRLNAKAVWFEQGQNGPEEKSWSAHFIETDNDYQNLYSPIRQPNIDNCSFMYRFTENGVTFYPETVAFVMSYIRNPAGAIRGVTLDLINEIEVYDPGTTTDLEWPESEYKRCSEILSYYAGIQVDDSEVVQWLSAKQIKEQ